MEQITMPMDKVMEVLKNGVYKISNIQEVNIAKDIKATIIIEKHSDEIKIKANARSDVLIMNLECQKIQEVILDEDAKCQIINIIFKDSTQKFILKKNSNLILKNISSINKSQLIITSTIEHLENNSKSLMISKGVLRNSKVTIKGIIIIDEQAYESNGYQKTEMMLLDDKSRAISIPELNIKNHDVKCTHGASISTLDMEKLFYMQSRGLDIEESRELIIQGFFASLLKDLDEDIFNKIMHKLNVRENIET